MRDGGEREEKWEREGREGGKRCRQEGVRQGRDSGAGTGLGWGQSKRTVTQRGWEVEAIKAAWVTRAPESAPPPKYLDLLALWLH